MHHQPHHIRMGRYLLVTAVLVLAASPSQGFAQDITGEWEMAMDFGGRQSFATLTISKNADGTLADITTKFNTLLAQMATTGLQAAA